MIVTLTTDFGTRDGYVAAMKGAMLTVSPSVRFVDVSHEVAPQEVMEAAWVLRQSAWTFPEGTVHLAVVDPGVGTARRPLAARFRPSGTDREHLFVGPDNGLLSLLGDEPPAQIVVLDRPELWRASRASRTFHGRDVFAPVAAHLASGAATLRDVGSPTDEISTLRWALPRADEQGVEGWIVHVDRYGNCITNIPRETVEAHRADRRVKVYAGSTIIRDIAETYGSADGEPVALFGSSGALEVSVNKGDAASLLSLARGAAVRLIFETRSQRVRRLAEAG